MKQRPLRAPTVPVIARTDQVVEIHWHDYQGDPPVLKQTWIKRVYPSDGHEFPIPETH